MFRRKALKALESWKQSNNRKPLVLRGARQVGKTSIASIFGNQFSQYIYLNLEESTDRIIFQENAAIETVVESIFLSKRKNAKDSDTLIFIDEIQAYPQAIALLRYFYEKYPQLYIIAAGSLLETVFDKDISFPVGRVEYLPIKPLDFEEFLIALKEEQALDVLQTVPVPQYAHSLLLKLFHRYTLIGGMPEIVAEYAKEKDISVLPKTFESILTPYVDDIAKYASSKPQATILQNLIQTSLRVAGQRINFAGFGNSNYKSREVGDALRTLEKAFFIQLIYPATQTALPVLPNTRKSPKIQTLDTGLVNYFSGIQAEILQLKDLNDGFKGRITEHIVYQELIAQEKSVLKKTHFWVREKNTSQAEVDIIYTYHNHLIPIEIKSGATGTLRSLFEFMDRAPHDMAVRIYAGLPSIDELTTSNGKNFRLLNMPYYAMTQLNAYLDWAFNTI